MAKFEYKPEPGGNLESLEGVYVPTRDNYADLTALTRDLQLLIDYLDALEAEIESELLNWALDVDEEDTRLVDAHALEWPTDSLGEPSPQITYRYYKALRFRDSTAAAYIRERFEEAARDVSGSSDLDILQIADITRSEALLIQDFLGRHIGNVYDSSEQRLLETLQSWVQPALLYSKQLRTHFETRESRAQQLTEEELAIVTPEEAVQGQAVFKVKLNVLNESIVHNLDYLKRNFSEYAPVFYNRFLGPALDFRLKVGIKSHEPKIQQTLDSEINQASETLANDLKVALADQARRRSVYNTKMYQLQKDLVARDKYRDLIADLSIKGKELPNTGPRIMVPSTEPPEDIDYWYRFEDEVPGLVKQASPSSGNIGSSHGALTGLELNHHPQYLLRTGGHMYGDITMETGVKIDGIVPSTHSHTGEDGSARIHGKNIIGGTIGEDVIDTETRPPKPHNLRVESMEHSVIPPGLTTLDVTIAWESGAAETHEVQIARYFI